MWQGDVYVQWEVRVSATGNLTHNRLEYSWNLGEPRCVCQEQSSNARNDERGRGRNAMNNAANWTAGTTKDDKCKAWRRHGDFMVGSADDDARGDGAAAAHASCTPTGKRRDSRPQTNPLQRLSIAHCVLRGGACWRQAAAWAGLSLDAPCDTAPEAPACLSNVETPATDRVVKTGEPGKRTGSASALTADSTHMAAAMSLMARSVSTRRHDGWIGCYHARGLGPRMIASPS
jgi:hypothetical protein